MATGNRNYENISSRKIDPCLGYPLDKATRWIAEINMIFSLAYFILIVGTQILFVFIFEDLKDLIIKLDKDSKGYIILVTGLAILVICVLVAFMAICLASIYLNFLLYEGAKQKIYAKVRLWLAVATAHLFLVTIATTCLSVFVPKSLFVVVFETLQFIYLCYAIWVVHDFSREIQPPASIPNNSVGFYGV